MSCTTILVGKKASYDGSTLVARTEDSQSGAFTPKQFLVFSAENQPKHYQSVLTNFEMELPDNPLTYTALPDALREDGLWAAAGINEVNVGMSATETITTNPRVLGADPYVKDGISEEDMLTLVLPYIHSAREGVERLGAILEEYGTYESNGIAFSDENEIWWMETIGGHHWIARRVPDDVYVVNPNQFGMDHFEFNNPYGQYLYSTGLRDFINKHHLDLRHSKERFNPRHAFGSQKDKDRHYNTPRAWFIQKFLNPELEQDPKSFNLPWSLKPYRKITIEDIKYLLSGHYQDTPYDPYGPEGDATTQGSFRPIGINRTSQTAILQIRSDVADELKGVQWIAYGSMPFNTAVPFYTHIKSTPDYFANTTAEVTTDNFYWVNRIIAALADAHFKKVNHMIDQYIENTMALGHAMLYRVDAAVAAGETVVLEEEHQVLTDQIKDMTQDLLQNVLFEASLDMTNRFGMSD